MTDVWWNIFYTNRTLFLCRAKKLRDRSEESIMKKYLENLIPSSCICILSHRFLKSISLFIFSDHVNQHTPDIQSGCTFLCPYITCASTIHTQYTCPYDTHASTISTQHACPYDTHASTISTQHTHTCSYDNHVYTIPIKCPCPWLHATQLSALHDQIFISWTAWYKAAQEEWSRRRRLFSQTQGRRKSVSIPQRW